MEQQREWWSGIFAASYVGDIEQLKETLQYAVSKLRYGCESNNWKAPRLLYSLSLSGSGACTSLKQERIDKHCQAKKLEGLM
jgi:hypothetical protein